MAAKYTMKDKHTWMAFVQVGHQEPSLNTALNMKCVASSSIEDAECDRLQQQVMTYQFPPQDYDPRFCRSILSDEEKNEMVLFNARRIIPAFGRAEVHPLQPKTIDDQDVICQQCTSVVEPGSLVVSTDKTGSDVRWHPGCFTCTVCHQPLVDLTYFCDDGQRVFCGRHFAERFKPRCASCDEMIFCESYTEAEGRNWHRNHFLCIGCSGPLAGQHYVMRDGRPMCRRCFDQPSATDHDDDDQRRQEEEEKEEKEEEMEEEEEEEEDGEKSKTAMSLLKPDSVEVTDGRPVEEVEGRHCTSYKPRAAVNQHHPTNDLLTSDCSPHQHAISDWLRGRRCSRSRNPDDDLTYLSAPNLTTSCGDVANRTLKSSLKSRRKGQREGRLTTHRYINHHHHHQQQQQQQPGKDEDRRAVRFHLDPSAASPPPPPPRRSSSKTPLFSQLEMAPGASPPPPPRQQVWQPEKIQGQGTSWKQFSNTPSNSCIRPCQHHCMEGGHALHEPWPLVQGRPYQGETHQGREMCPLHGMTRSRGCQQHQRLSYSVLAYPTQGHSSQTERSFQCHSFQGHAPHSQPDTSNSNYQCCNWNLSNDYSDQGQPCKGRLLEGRRRWCHKSLGRWTRSQDNGIQQKHQSPSFTSLPGPSNSLGLNLQPMRQTGSDNGHVTLACNRCARPFPPLPLSTSGCRQRRMAETSSVVCAGHARSEVRHRSDANGRGKSSRPLLYGDIPHTEEESQWTESVSRCAPPISNSSVCSPSTAASSADSIDDPEYDHEECLQRSQAASTGGTAPAKNEDKKTKSENKKTKKKKKEEAKVDEESEVNRTGRKGSTSKSLPELNKVEKTKDKNREKRKRCIVS